MKLKIKKGSVVEVISGADRGKKGEVLEVSPKKLQIKVQGVKIQTHFDRQEGLQTKEGFLDYSNVRLVSAPSVTQGKKSSIKAGRKPSEKKAKARA